MLWQINQHPSSLDWTLILAIWGAILSTLLFVKEMVVVFSEINKGKRILRVECTFGVATAFQFFENQALEKVLSPDKILKVNVVNTGYRPITITSVGVRLNDGATFRTPETRGLSAKLDDGEESVFDIEINELSRFLAKARATDNNAGFDFVIIQDAEGHTYKGNLPEEFVRLGLKSVPRTRCFLQKVSSWGQSTIQRLARRKRDDIWLTLPRVEIHRKNLSVKPRWDYVTDQLQPPVPRSQSYAASTSNDSQLKTTHRDVGPLQKREKVSDNLTGRPSQTTRLAVAVDDFDLRKDLIALVSQELDLELAAVARIDHDVAQLVTGTEPHVVLLELTASEERSFELVRAIHHGHPRTYILVLTVASDVDLLRRLTLAGASSVFARPFQSNELVHAIRQYGEIARNERALGLGK